MKTLLSLVGATALGAGLLVAAPAQAAPPGASAFIPLTCDNGVSTVVQVTDGETSARSAWIDGHGVAARAFARTESGTVHLADGSTATYSVAELPGVQPGQSGKQVTRSTAALSQTTACRLPLEDFDLTVVLTAQDTAYVGIDVSYAGTEAEVVGTGQTTVYLATGQLAARS